MNSTKLLATLGLMAVSVGFCFAQSTESRIIFENDNIVGYIDGGSQTMTKPTGSSVEQPPESESTQPSKLIAQTVPTMPSQTAKPDDLPPEMPLMPAAVKKRIHSLAQKHYLYPISFGVKSKDSELDVFYERTLTFDKLEKCEIALESGEIYQLYFENKSDKSVCLRILVDGLNTLSENVNGEYRFAPPVAIDKARHYVVPPKETVMIQGFFGEENLMTQTDKALVVEQKERGASDTNGQFFCPFIVDKSSRSLAAQKGAESDIGTITVGVYEFVKPSTQYLALNDTGPSRGRGQGTSAGQKKDTKVEYAQDGAIGRQLDCYTIHY